jgi:hypothetical protein
MSYDKEFICVYRSVPSELYASFVSRYSGRWPQQYVMYSTDFSPFHTLLHILSVLFSKHYSGPLTYELNSFPRAGRNSSWS